MPDQDSIASLAATATRKPNFFLLGAGRCGSTTLYHMLKQHPQVFMPEIKEPSFFCSYFQVVRNPVDYFQLFSQAKDAVAVGEASHVYLSNPESASILRLLFPDAKFILIFRDPAERAYSLYHWARNAKLEPLETFEAALDAEAGRYADPKFFRECPQYFWNFMYVRSSYYHAQWQRYLDIYPRDRFFVVSLHELVGDPVRWVQKMYEFLGVRRDFTPIVRALNALTYPPMSPATRRELDHHFAHVVAATHALAGRDLKLHHA